MDSTSELEFLLERWEEMRSQGELVDLVQLCQAAPKLLPELQRRVAALERISRLAPDIEQLQQARAASDFLPKTPGFELLREVGRGGMGVVYLARQLGLNRDVALKMILAGQFADQKARLRFQIEGETLARLQHPHIVQVFEVGAMADSDSGISRPYLVFEYAAGGSLEDRLSQREFSPVEAAEILAILAGAAHYAHLRGVIHRDLKPANILFARAEFVASGQPSAVPENSPIAPREWQLLKIGDFGLARLLDNEAMSAAGALVGTPGYVPPELCRGEIEQLGPTTDVFALGAILFRLLTRQLPFEGKSGMEILRRTMDSTPQPPRRLNPKAPRDLESICLKCLAKSPKDRYQSAQLLEEDLLRFLAGKPTRARPVNAIERAWKWTKRRPAVAALTGALAGAVAIAIGVSIAANILLARSNVRERLARDEAERNFQEARAVVDDYMTTVSQKDLIGAPGTQLLRKELLTKALEYHKSFAARHADDPQNRLNVAASLMKVAQIVGETQSSAAALEWYKQAIDRFLATIKDGPEEAATRRSLAECLELFGIELRRSGRPEESRTAIAESIVVLRNLLDVWPDDVAALRLLGRSYANLSATLGSLGQNRESIEQAKLGLAARERLALLTPGDRRIVRYNAIAFVNLGCDQLDLMELPGALSSFQAARKNLEQLSAEAKPGDADQTVGANLGDLTATAWWNIGKTQYELGDPREAIRAFDRSVEIWNSLTAKNPAVKNFRWKLAVGRSGRGESLLALDRPADALADYAAARDVLKALLKEEAGGAALTRSQWAAATDGLAGVLARQGRQRESQAEFEAAAAEHRKALAQAPNMAEVRLGMSDHYRLRAAAHRALGEKAKAQDAARESIKHASKSVRPFILGVRELVRCGLPAEAHKAVEAGIADGWLESRWLLELGNRPS